MKEYPRVLCGAPTSIRHAYCVDEWLEGIRGLDYPKDKIEVVVVDNTPFDADANEEFYAHLKNLGLRVVRYPWNRKGAVTQMLATCREVYRQIAYFEHFDYIFHLDTDTIVGKDSLKTLLSRDKDQIGVPVHVFPKKVGKKFNYQPPCVFKQLGFGKKGLFYYSWHELKKIKERLRKGHKRLIYKVAGAPLGCLLVKRKVFERVPFSSAADLLLGEDVWYHNNASEKGFEFWIDFSVKVKHKNTNWQSVKSKDSRNQRLWVGFGREDAKNIVVNDYVKRRRTIIKTEE